MQRSLFETCQLESVGAAEVDGGWLVQSQATLIFKSNPCAFLELYPCLNGKCPSMFDSKFISVGLVHILERSESGLILFSFWRLKGGNWNMLIFQIQKSFKTGREKYLSVARQFLLYYPHIPVTKPNADNFLLHVQLIADMPDFIWGRFGVLDEDLLQWVSNVVFNRGPFLPSFPNQFMKS